jgi:phage terminase large subunit-like protein
MNAERLRQYAVDPLAFLFDLMIPSVHGPRRFGDCMAEFQRHRFAGLAPALLALAHGERPQIGRHFWEATKGASKDSDLAASLLWLLAFTKRPLLCQVGAADQDQADELRKAAKDILRLNPWLADRLEVQNWRIVCKATDAVCEIIAADTAGSHGARPDVLIINELSHITKQEFAENLRDNSAKVPYGLVVIATNAGFTGTWQFKWRELARTSDRWSFHALSEPAPWLDPAEIEEAKRRNASGRYLRLWWGQWVSGSGDALDPADVEAAVTLSGPMDARMPEWVYCGGLDVGHKHDHSGFAIVARNRASQRMRLVQMFSWAPARGGEVDLQNVEDIIVRLNETFRMSQVNFDPHQAAFLAQRLKKRGVRVNEVPFIGGYLTELASTLLEAFRARTISLYRDELLLKDLSRLVIVERPVGFKLESTRDADGHADRATALALAMLAARDAKPLRKVLVA